MRRLPPVPEETHLLPLPTPSRRTPRGDRRKARPSSQANPNVVAVAAAADHTGERIVGSGCDDQFEFEFALDLLLDGFERLHNQGWGD